MAQLETAAPAAPPENVYPPSPQWNQPHSACLVYSPSLADKELPQQPQDQQQQDQNSQGQQPTKGWFLYTLNNAIHILNPASFKYEGMLVGPHTGKINALAGRPAMFVEHATSSALGRASVEALLNQGLSPAASPSASLLSSASPVPSQEQHALGDHAVSSQSKESRTIVATAGDDRNVVCWDVLARRPIYTLPNVHETEIKAVEWLYDGVTVVSGDRSGCITIWNPFKAKHFKRAPMDKSPIACIRACPSPGQDNVAAIGYETGDILICQLRLTDTALLRRLHGHSGRIHSLAWQPHHRREEAGERGGDKALGHRDKIDGSVFTCLASGSADQTIRIWDVDKTRTKMVAKIPGPGGKQAHQQQTRVKAWVPVEWTSDGLAFMSFTFRGGQVMWKVDETPDKVHRIVRGCQHTRMVYQVLVWRTGEFAFSFGMDRRIIVWDLMRNEGMVQVDGLAGPVDALDVSHLDPGRLAIANGNDSITLWNTLSQDVPYESIIVDRLTSRVRCLAWHPSEEGTIAFGLDNGKIGMIDRVYEWNPQQALLRPPKYKASKRNQSSQGPLPVFFPSYHGSAVLSIQWCSSKAFSAPVLELLDLCLEDRSSCLVTCGDDGKILVTVATKGSANNTSLDLDLALTRQNSAWYEELRLRTGWSRIQRRSFAIHPNEDLMAIGCADGSVEIIELQHFRVVHVYHGHKTKADQLAWCWIGDGAEDNAGNNLQQAAPYLLACGSSDEGFISVLHLDQYAPSSHADHTSGLITSADQTHSIAPSLQCFQKFHCHPGKGKRRGCSSLAWSPHRGTDNEHRPVYRFASASYDGSVAVCEVMPPSMSSIPSSASADVSPNMSVEDAKTARKAFPIARFVPHHQITNSIRWSLTAEHNLHTGGSDWRVCVWDWRKYRISEGAFKELVLRCKSGLTENSIATSVSGRRKQLQQDKVCIREIEKAEERITNDVPTSAAAPSNKRPLSAQTDAQEGTSEVEPGSVVPPKKKLLLQSHSLAAAVQDVNDGHYASGAIGKRANLFPRSSAAFKSESRRRTLLEVIRLARNLYCRPRWEHPAIADSTRRHRQRWKAMLRFFEADGEPEGQVLAAALRKDVDELNIDDDGDDNDDDEKGQENGDNAGDSSADASHVNSVNEESVERESRPRSFKEGDSRDSGSVPSSVNNTASRSDLCLAEPRKGNLDGTGASRADSLLVCPPTEEETTDGDAFGDLIFYGSREAIISLAQMESQALVDIDAESGRNVFHVGSGMGVVYSHVPAIPKRGTQNGNNSITSTTPAVTNSDNATKAHSTSIRRGPRSHSNKLAAAKAAHLSRIPISYWLGDVPDMMDILSSSVSLGMHDWIGLALSPMGGAAAWRRMMDQMARKCLAHGEVHAAVLCHLGIGQVSEAVEAYRANDMFREALMLLKIRMWEEIDGDGEMVQNDNVGEAMMNLDNDGELRRGNTGVDVERIAQQVPRSLQSGFALHTKILADWGRFHERRGEYEQAAKCQLALGTLLASSSATAHQSQGRGDGAVNDSLHSEYTLRQQGSLSPAGARWSMGLQTLSRRGDLATIRVVAGLTILLQDRFQQLRIQQYNNAAHAKRTADEERRLKASIGCEAK